MATRRPGPRSGEPSHIRVVGADERSPDPAVAELFRPDPAVSEAPAAEDVQPKVQTLAEAVAGGNYREILEAQVRDIVNDLKSANGQAKAALHGRLMVISKEIEALKVATPGDANSVVATSTDESWDSSVI